MPSIITFYTRFVIICLVQNTPPGMDRLPITLDLTDEYTMLALAAGGVSSPLSEGTENAGCWLWSCCHDRRRTNTPDVFWGAVAVG